MNTETTTMMTELKERLSSHPQVAYWSILHQETRAWQHYLAKERPEATREVANELYHVTLYHQHPHPDGSGAAQMGSATIVLTLWDLHRLAEVIEDGVLIAALTNNRPWTLPEATVFPEVPLADLESLQDPYAMIESFSERLRKAVQKEPHVRLSAAELFFEETVSTICNSAGLQGRQHETECLLELTLLATDPAGRETEHFLTKASRRIADLQLEEIVANNAALARDSLVAALPQTWNGAVVLDSALLPELFEPLAQRVTAEAAHNKTSPVQRGESLFGNRAVAGDPLHVTYSALVPYGARSYVFDAEGVPGQEVRAVENGRFTRYLATQRYADYLGVAATGRPGNLQVATGQLTEQEVLAGPACYIMAVSSLMPNLYTGDFAVEIKLGYYIDAAGKRTPIKGGSVSGNLFEALAHAHFAQEEVQTAQYRGPKAVRFAERLTISGE